MKRSIRCFATLFLLIAIAFGTVGCTSKASQIKDTLSEFEYACRNLDVDAMLKCIDPDVSDPIRLGMAVFSTITGTDYEDIVDVLFANISEGEFGTSFDAKDFLSTISVSDVKVKTKKNTATVTCKISFELAGEQFERDAAIDMGKRDDKWYITYFEILSAIE